MNRVAGIAALVVGVVALAAMRATTPHFVTITGPIDYTGCVGKPVRAGNLLVTAGRQRLARAIRFRAAGKVENRDSGGLWLIVPVVSRVGRETASIVGRTWVTADGRRYSTSGRVESGDAVLSSTKTTQPGLERCDLAVFELPPAEAMAGGTLLLSEPGDPQLSAEARIRFCGTLPVPPVATIDLDDLHAKL